MSTRDDEVVRFGKVGWGAFKDKDPQGCDFVLQQVVTLFMQSFNAHPWNEHWTVKTAGKHLSELMLGPFDLFLIKQQDKTKIPAFGLGIPLEHYQHAPQLVDACRQAHRRKFRSNETYYLAEFATFPDDRGKGYCREIMVAAMLEAAKRGDQVAVLQTHHDDPVVTAIACGVLGFKQVAEHDLVVGGKSNRRKILSGVTKRPSAVDW